MATAVVVHIRRISGGGDLSSDVDCREGVSITGFQLLPFWERFCLPPRAREHRAGAPIDAFTIGPAFVDEAALRLDVVFEGVVVVHPAAALRFCSQFLVGVFENANRATEGEKPQFVAKALYVFDRRD